MFDCAGSAGWCVEDTPLTDFSALSARAAPRELHFMVLTGCAPYRPLARCPTYFIRSDLNSGDLLMTVARYEFPPDAENARPLGPAACLILDWMLDGFAPPDLREVRELHK